ncbi:LysE family translocator [Hydrogenophaga sp. OTU3427]|uniref:LysE family translocator n=1 Tax=Hydrogenophaga sp. OTU3427 TaxID=3043856 RepID=UPI00313AE36E
MPDAHQLMLFIAAGWLLNLTPGPDVLYIVTHALRSGARAGIVAGLGITAGCFVHIVAAALGVGALLAASATAFNLLKWLGAAYLFYVGIKLLFAKPGGSPLAKAADRPTDAVAPAQPWRVFTGGFWTNVLNPKVALFFLAFVPQFIAPGTEHTTWVFLALGVLFNVNAIPVNVGWALAAAWMARRAAVVQRGLSVLDRVAGALFIAFGLKLALSSRP